MTCYARAVALPSVVRFAAAFVLGLALIAATASAALGKPRKSDRDRDGLSNRYEVRVSKTNPRRKDTDRDRLSDRYELRRSKTNPRRRDTDRDGLTDGDEVLRFRTNPRRRDTDRDGTPDGADVLLTPLSVPLPGLPGPLSPPELNKRPPRGDTTAPTVDFRTPSTGQKVSGRLDEPSGNCEALASDASGVTKVEFYLDGQYVNMQTEFEYACEFNTADYPDGAHTIMARAYDPRGNSSTDSVSVVFDNVPDVPVPDTTEPETTISSGPSGSTTSASASFGFSSSESGSTFECKLDAGSWAACSSPKDYSGVAVGSHTFSVRAKDAAGNVDASPATRSWTVTAPTDTTAPDTTISSGPSGSTTSASASFGFSSSESGSTFECKLDAGSWAACSSPKDYSGVAVGSHTFSVRAKDAAGNTDASPATRAWSVTEASTPPPASSGTRRDIPVSPAGYLGNFNLTSRSYVVANRFVLDQRRTIDRWYANVVGEGTNCVGGRTGYGDGDGGTLRGRIVEVNQSTGMPTGVVLAEETVNGCTSWQRAKNEFSLVQTHAAHYFQFPAVTLEADRMYAFLLTNVHSNPGSGTWNSGGDNGNHMSSDHNFAPLSQMGPHGRNNVDPNATGALYGLDPRETTMWSGDSGSSWKFGDQVGWYQLGNGIGRMWTGAGYRVASTGENVAHGWPYNNDPGEAAATVTFKNSPKDVTLTKAGGSASSGSVGVVTVRNTRTGVQGQTSGLGSGVQRATLNNPVPIAAGDSYTVSNSGVVDTGDGHRGSIFGLGQRSPFNYSSSGSRVSKASDLPMLFATPHPYY